MFYNASNIGDPPPWYWYYHQLVIRYVPMVLQCGMRKLEGEFTCGTIFGQGKLGNFQELV
jgi:hypothetical protein